MMKRFAFLLVCLLFSTTLIGMTRAKEGEQPNEGDNKTGDKANQGGEDVNTDNGGTGNETKTGTDEEPSKGNDETMTNAPETDDTVTEAATDPTVTEAKKDDAEATTKGSAGSVLPNLLVVVATAVAGYNFAS